MTLNKRLLGGNPTQFSFYFFYFRFYFHFDQFKFVFSVFLFRYGFTLAGQTRGQLILGMGKYLSRAWRSIYHTHCELSIFHYFLIISHILPMFACLEDVVMFRHGEVVCTSNLLFQAQGFTIISLCMIFLLFFQKYMLYLHPHA